LLDEDPGIIRELYIKPEEVWFRAHFPPQLPKKQIELWFEETLQLAGLLEAQ
jgi:hypothetical protein